MRSVALGVLAITCGCNQIFGLDSTKPYDGGVDGRPDAPYIKIDLRWAIANTDLMGAPVPMLELEPLGSDTLSTGVPTIKVGALATTDLVDAPYDVSDGTFIVPFDLPGHPWRVVYTLPGSPIPREIQWNVSTAHLVWPRTSRWNAPIAPTGGGYDITPTGAPTLVQPSVWTTSGVFTNTPLMAGEHAGTRAMFGFSANALPLAGPRGAPETAKGDGLLLVDRGTLDANTTGVVGWAVTRLDLHAGSLTVATPSPPWFTTVSTFTSKPGGAGPMGAVTRLNTATGGFVNTPSERTIYGLSPNLLLPGFVPDPSVPAERPLMFPLSERNLNTISPQPKVDVDSVLTPLEKIVCASYSATRTSMGTALTSTLQVMWPIGMLNQPMYFPAPIAISTQLGSVSLSADGSMVSLGSNAFVLTWTPDGGMNVGADDYVIGLYELSGIGITPIRTYQVLNPSVVIDRTLFQMGHHYVFGITAHHGFPGATNADFSTVTYPFGSSTLVTGYFTVTT
jgi:hypothetical protein